MMNQKNNCNHSFFLIKDEVDRDISGREMSNSIHAYIGCCWCGQIRKIYHNGQVKVVVHKGTISYEV